MSHFCFLVQRLEQKFNLLKPKKSLKEPINCTTLNIGPCFGFGSRQNIIKL